MVATVALCWIICLPRIKLSSLVVINGVVEGTGGSDTLTDTSPVGARRGARQAAVDRTNMQTDTHYALSLI